MVMNINHQIAAMESHYPNLVVVKHSNRYCYWEGKIKPYRKTFLIRIEYYLPIIPENVTCGEAQPRVQVLSPILERHSDFEEGPIPHIYENKLEPSLPFLCLFDPDAMEWTTDDLISETTIPWTERWLFNYEFWLATGFWDGGGRHMDTRELEKCSEGIMQEVS